MRVGYSKRGFTLIELLVVIAIIAILAAILFPVFASAKLKGQQAQCAGNLKQLIIAAQAYHGDYGSYTGIISAPEGSKWLQYYHFQWIKNGVDPVTFSPIFRYCKSAEIMRCSALKGMIPVSEDQQRLDKVGPKARLAWTYTFCYSLAEMNPDSAPNLSKKGMWVEENWDPSRPSPSGDPDAEVAINDMSFAGSDLTAWTHTGKCNVAFADGHVSVLDGGLECNSAKWPGTHIHMFKRDYPY